MTIKAKSETSCWQIDADEFEASFPTPGEYKKCRDAVRMQSVAKYQDRKEHNDLQAEAALQICKTTKLFGRHSPEAMLALLSLAVLVELKADEVLFCAGEEGDSLFILMAGELACITTEHKEVAVLRKGAVFGELAALRLNKERSVTVKAKSEAKMWQVDADDFKSSFSNPAKYAALRNSMQQTAAIKYKDGDKLKKGFDKEAAEKKAQAENERAGAAAAAKVKALPVSSEPVNSEYSTFPLLKTIQVRAAEAAQRAAEAKKRASPAPVSAMLAKKRAKEEEAAT